MRWSGSICHHSAMTAAIDLDSVLDEQHAAVLSMLPPDLFDLSDIPAARARLDGLLAMMPAPELPSDVTITEVMAPSPDGAPDVRLKVFTPSGLESGAGALLWVHGGGMVLMDSDDLKCATWASTHGCLVVWVDYRLAPETHAPGALNDCFAGLIWLAGNSEDLGVDPSRVMIGGASAGAGLAAGTTMRVRDDGGPQLLGQLLVYPMLDHRNETSSSRAIQDQRVWNRSANTLAWEAYLGGAEPTRYSSPALADDLSGLPPAYISVGTCDMFLDEDVAYATALTRAGVSCELHVYPGAFHASNKMLPDHPTSIRWHRDEDDFISRCLAGQL
jgi:acetyl esterase/lipase